jgi:hypothetical protein
MAKSPANTRVETKTETLRRLLCRKTGADMATLQSATGWQAHSVRAALSGLRKAGYTIDLAPAAAPGTLSIYQITGTPENLT